MRSLHSAHLGDQPQRFRFVVVANRGERQSRLGSGNGWVILAEPRGLFAYRAAIVETRLHHDFDQVAADRAGLNLDQPRDTFLLPGGVALKIVCKKFVPRRHDRKWILLGRELKMLVGFCKSAARSKG